MVELDATAVTRGSSSSGDSANGVTIVCEPPLDTSPLLAPGKSLECTAEIDIEQDDVNRGEVTRGRDVSNSTQRKTSCDANDRSVAIQYFVGRHLLERRKDTRSVNTRLGTLIIHIYSSAD